MLLLPAFFAAPAPSADEQPMPMQLRSQSSVQAAWEISIAISLRDPAMGPDAKRSGSGRIGNLESNVFLGCRWATVGVLWKNVAAFTNSRFEPKEVSGTGFLGGSSRGYVTIARARTKKTTRNDLLPDSMDLIKCD